MWSNRVADFIARHHLLCRESLCLVALSGGADSVALLLVLLRLGYRVEAAHCNFHLRGAEADRDEQFCADLCQRQGVALHRAHFDTRAWASLHHVSIEMAARELRYRYFEQLRQDVGASAVCVAHHRDDSVETVLLNLVRGTGITGLTGIAPVSGHIVRPLLCVSREEIVAWLESMGQAYVTDSTNLVADVKRNKIRLQLLPLLRELNPSVAEAITTMSAHLAQVERVADSPALHAPYAGDRLAIGLLRREQSAEYMLWHRLAPLGFTPAQVGEMAAGVEATAARSGQQWASTTHRVVRDRDTYIIYAHTPVRERPLVIPEAGRYAYDDTTSLRVTSEAVTAGYELRRGAGVALLDAATVRFPLTVRRVAPGDRFMPLGMTGTRLVSDFLTDRKRNVVEKERQLVVTDREGEILWLVGMRPDHRHRITGNTRECVRIETIYPE